MCLRNNISYLEVGKENSLKRKHYCMPTFAFPFTLYCVYASVCSLSGKMLNSCNCGQRYSCSFCQCVADCKSLSRKRQARLLTSSEDQGPSVVFKSYPKLLLAMKSPSSVASSDTLLNKHIKWFGCTSRYVSHSAIYCSSPCYSLQTQTG